MHGVTMKINLSYSHYTINCGCFHDTAYGLLYHFVLNNVEILAPHRHERQNRSGHFSWS